MNMELRFHDAAFVAEEDGTLTVSGYVNETDTYSGILGTSKKFIERIAKGAFSKAIGERTHDIDFLAEHDKYKILASTRNNTLDLIEDERGLFMSARIVPTSFGKDYYELINSGILRNMSFGFRVVKDNWKAHKPGLYERTITALELVEVSVVRNPAYSSSTIAARGIDIIEDVTVPEEAEKENRDMEKLYAALASLESRLGEVVDAMKETRALDETETKTDETEEIKETEKTEENLETETDETKVEETEETKVDEENTEVITDEQKEEKIPDAEEAEEIKDETKEEKTDEAEEKTGDQRSTDLVDVFSELRTILSELREKGEINIEP